jgi:hypothetical protein
VEGSNWPIVLIEGVLVFGGVLAFGWWQLRSVERDRRKAAEEREAAQRDGMARRADEVARPHAPDSGSAARVDPTDPEHPR